MKFEIELRGPLTKSKFQSLLNFLREQARFIKKTERTTFVFHTNDKTLDLKIRTTDGASEIIVKKGFWGARKREEIVLPIEAEAIGAAKKILTALGYQKGIIAERETFIFEYKGIELSLVKCPKDYYFYEAEFIRKRSIRNPEEYVKQILKLLGLKIWSEKEVYEFLMFCNRKIDKHFAL